MFEGQPIVQDINSGPKKNKDSAIRCSFASKESNQKLGMAFKLNPTVIHKMSRSKTLQSPTYQPSERDSPTTAEQLNRLLLLRKVSKQKLFFDDEVQHRQIEARSKDKINQDIDHSIQYIESVKKRKGIPRIGLRKLPKIVNQHRTIGEALGLELQLNSEQTNSAKLDSKRFITEPVDCNTRRSQGKPGHHLKIKTELAEVGLYSYLEREFISGNKELSSTKIFKYAQNPNNSNFQRQVLQKSRDFLKDRVRSNYREMGRVFEHMEGESRKLIEEETLKKRSLYKREYSLRRNVPYFSFLSMSPREKKSVVQALNRRTFEV